MQGKIVKGIAGFYYVYVAEFGIYECKAKGIFRKEKKKPLVGDSVRIDVLNESEKEGNITEILPRKNELIRPAAANVDQALVVFAVRKPEPHFQLLDRFLVMMKKKDVPVILCFNKKDNAGEHDIENLREIYQNCGCEILFTSARRREHIDEIAKRIKGKTTVLAGPSGVGKSSLINLLQSDVRMETGAVSRKIDRGRHTTRHCELIMTDENSYIMDTPGFTSLFAEDMEKEELQYYFPEFHSYIGRCRYNGCSHIHEPDCAVKSAVEQGKIHRSRYRSYLDLYEELQRKRRY